VQASPLATPLECPAINDAWQTINPHRSGFCALKNRDYLERSAGKLRFCLDSGAEKTD
jgi:hypothetical protein